jgi:hypothetical protein
MPEWTPKPGMDAALRVTICDPQPDTNPEYGPAFEYLGSWGRQVDSLGPNFELAPWPDAERIAALEAALRAVTAERDALLAARRSSGSAGGRARSERMTPGERTAAARMAARARWGQELGEPPANAAGNPRGDADA